MQRSLPIIVTSNKIRTMQREALGDCHVSEEYGNLWHLILAIPIDRFLAAMDNVELLQLAIRRLADDKKNGGASFADDDLLSSLISQLESLKEVGAINQTESAEGGELPSPAVGVAANEVDVGSIGMGTEEIIKELKKVEKQNSRTHWLLSIMIVLILGWQFSEFSLILMVKRSINHPFKSFGNLIIGMLKRPESNGEDAENHPHRQRRPTVEPLPSLSHLDLPMLGSNAGGD